VLSRNQKDLGGKFSEVKDSIAALDLQDAIVDGEIIGLDEKGKAGGTAEKASGGDHLALSQRIWVETLG
jgi:ATP-dependent DNA ligase